jgi:hypothetical protein
MRVSAALSIAPVTAIVLMASAGTANAVYYRAPATNCMADPYPHSLFPDYFDGSLIYSWGSGLYLTGEDGLWLLCPIPDQSAITRANMKHLWVDGRANGWIESESERMQIQVCLTQPNISGGYGIDCDAAVKPLGPAYIHLDVCQGGSAGTNCSTSALRDAANADWYPELMVYLNKDHEGPYYSSSLRGYTLTN